MALRFKFLARNGTSFGVYDNPNKPISYADIRAINSGYRTNHNVQVRKDYSNEYNCHGLTFAGKLGWFDIFGAGDVRILLTAHNFNQVSAIPNFSIDSLPSNSRIERGDVILYYSGDPVNVTHTGVVWKVSRNGNVATLTILSKWGVCGEYFHNYKKVPTEYGTSIEVWSDR